VVALTTSAKRRDVPRAAPVDPITSEIIRYSLLAVPNQISKNIARTAFSPLIYEYKDYAVGILDKDARLITQAKGSLPIFVANALGVAVRDGLEIYGRENIHPGDIIITNHSGTLGQHLNNVVMYTPIHVGPNAELFGFMAILAHWIDVGGGIVGSFLRTDSSDIYQEGIQFRTVRLEAQGERVEDIYRIIGANTRFPKMVAGDVAAQRAGCLLGRDMVMDVVERFGKEAVDASIESMWGQTEAETRSAISGIPDGEYSASAFLDDDGVAREVKIPVDVVVRVSGDEMTIDLSGLGPQTKGPINAGFNGGALAACRIACKFLFTPGETGNDGAFRPLKVIVPDGTFLSAAADAPMGWSGTTLPTVVDTILKAVAPAAPDRITAAHHGTYGSYIFHGHDPLTNELFQHIDSSAGGWGAGRNHDGTGPSRSYVHGDIQDVPAEMQEVLYPLQIDSAAMRQDSGGAGTYRGGLGIERRYTTLAPCVLTVNFDRTECPPWGLEGGLPGKSGDVEILRNAASAPERILKGTVRLDAGDKVRIVTGGGGGFGPPRDRDPERLRADLEDGLISIGSAIEDYGANWLIERT
jgi:N-methylhydantoinase B